MLRLADFIDGIICDLDKFKRKSKFLVPLSILRISPTQHIRNSDHNTTRKIESSIGHISCINPVSESFLSLQHTRHYVVYIVIKEDIVNMRGSRMFCQRRLKFVKVFFLFFLVEE